jgi:hypothetical protein
MSQFFNSTSWSHQIPQNQTKWGFVHLELILIHKVTITPQDSTKPKHWPPSISCNSS